MLASLLLWLWVVAPAEIVDRIAVSVGNQVITESEVVEQIRVAAFLNRETPDFGPEAKRKAAERLVEQTLFRRDMEFAHFAAPGVAEAAGMEEEIRQRYASGAEFEDGLRRGGLSLGQLRAHLRWQIMLLRFIEYRFAPAVQISDDEIAKYYAAQRAEWERQKRTPVPELGESRAAIEKILTQQRVDQAVDRWLGDTRTQVEIRYRAEAFR